MGKTILTPHQSQVLELIAKTKSLTDKFYLTGGTALAEFYLKHRLSEDLDFFSEQECPILPIESFFKAHSDSLEIVEIERVQHLGLFTFFLKFKDKTILKVDFNFYPFPRIDTGTKFHSLSVDSSRDIAANKTHVLFMQPRERDYVDLYFLMNKYGFELNQLIKDAKIKFDWHIDKLKLAENLLKSIDITSLPKMLVPFKKGDMDEFFKNQAKSLGKDIFS